MEICCYLRDSFLQSRVHEVVQKLKKGAGRHDVAVDQVGHEPKHEAGVAPAAALETVLGRLDEKLHALPAEVVVLGVEQA